jgi:hypothetical protein
MSDSDWLFAFIGFLFGAITFVLAVAMLLAVIR